MPNKIRRLLFRQLRKMRFLPPKMYAHFCYEYWTGKKLNLKNPKEFNEKIQWYKVFYHPKILNTLVDKYEVRKIIANKIGKQYLNEIYGVYDNVEEIPFKDLPNEFVIKATHSSGHNIIVKDKSQLDIKKVSKKLRKWLNINQYYRIGQEWAYKDVKPRYIIEKYLEEEGQGSLIDYKFYCFDGVAKFVDIHTDREDNHKQGCFDLNFNLLPFGKGSHKKSLTTTIKKPNNFENMVKLSETLAANFPFVRVDFYSIDGKSVFGEMTFYPGDGRKDFYPDKYNKIIGDYFKLPKLSKGQKFITEIN